MENSKTPNGSNIKQAQDQKDIDPLYVWSDDLDPKRVAIAEPPPGYASYDRTEAEHIHRQLTAWLSKPT